MGTGHHPAPEPVLPDDQLVHLLNRDTLGLRHAEDDEQCHEDHESGEKDEHTPRHHAEHREECLANEESESVGQGQSTIRTENTGEYRQ